LASGKLDQEREHDSEDEDDDKYADDIDMPGQNFDSKRRITVRNLRIREDTAKVRDTSGNTVQLLLCLTEKLLGLCLVASQVHCANG